MRCLFAFCLTCIFLTPVSAQTWRTVTELDAGSGKKLATMIVMATLTEGVYFRCGSENSFLMSVVMKNKNDKSLGATGTLVSTVGDNEALRLTGISYSHNAQYIGFKADDLRVRDFVSAISTMTGVGPLRFRVEAAEVNLSFATGLAGAKEAAANFLKTCSR